MSITISVAQARISRIEHFNTYTRIGIATTQPNKDGTETTIFFNVTCFGNSSETIKAVGRVGDNISILNASETTYTSASGVAYRNLVVNSSYQLVISTKADNQNMIARRQAYNNAIPSSALDTQENIQMEEEGLVEGGVKDNTATTKSKPATTRRHAKKAASSLPTGGDDDLPF